MTFVDRERELEDLRRLAEDSHPRLALLYGRRRVGKTALLREAWRGRRHFYFLAADTTPGQNRQDLIQTLGRWAEEDLRPEDFPTWRSAFRVLERFSRDEPLVVVLDEFQYLLAEGDPEGVASQLNAVWEGELADARITLVLCGSEVGTMEGLASRGALYGRVDWSGRLAPFDYFDAALMTPTSTLRDRAYAYGVLGGMPRYLEVLDPDESLAESVIRSVLSPSGSVHLQVENLIHLEESIRDPGQYRAVLAAVAGGRTELNGIAQAAGLQERKHVARRALEVLEDLHVITRERNFDAGRTAAWRYRIMDNCVRFWYRFVHPNRSELETQGTRRIWTRRVEPRLDDYMGWRTFEDMTRQAFRRHHSALQLPGPLEWTRWEGQDRKRRSIELDLVARLDDDRLLTGEVKWSSAPVGPGLYHDLVRDLQDLAASGKGWAREALDPDRSHGHLLVSAAGFTEDLRARAEADDRIHLMTLEDFYPEG